MRITWLKAACVMLSYFSSMLIILLLPNLVSAEEISVGENQSLQQAIDDASAGDVIKLKKGLYKGSVTITKALSIVGEEGVIIDGEGEGNVLTIIADDVTLEGVTIQNSGKGTNESGIYVKDGDRITIQGNVIQDALHGIYIENGTDNTISGNEISSFAGRLSDKGHGVYLSGGSSFYLEGNVFMGVQDGVYSENVDGVELIENQVYYSRYAIHLMFNKNVRLEGNHLEGNITGVMCMDSQQIDLISNEIIDHFNVRGFGIIIYDSADIAIKENDVRLNSTGLSLEKTVEVQIERNIISGNQVGLEFIGSNEGNVFTENNFIGNVVQSKITNNQMQLDNGVRGNYWDDYSSYDVTGDGIGDITYKAGSLYDQLLEKQPYWQFFFESPSIQLWSKAETLFPSIGIADVYDENPLVEPVALSEKSTENKERDIGILLLAIPFLWFSILLIWLGRHYS
ncbi:MAG: nitrous oxide reductase family maturation protein NosD [Bacillus sp. (in: firmicutes)]